MSSSWTPQRWFSVSMVSTVQTLCPQCPSCLTGTVDHCSAAFLRLYASKGHVNKKGNNQWSCVHSKWRNVSSSAEAQDALWTSNHGSSDFKQIWFYFI